MSPAGIQDASQSLLANCRSLIPVTQLTGVGRILVALCYQLAELIFGPDLAGLDNDLTTLNIDLNTVTFIQMRFSRMAAGRIAPALLPIFRIVVLKMTSNIIIMWEHIIAGRAELYPCYNIYFVGLMPDHID